jgi:hypothetical protein
MKSIAIPSNYLVLHCLVKAKRNFLEVSLKEVANIQVCFEDECSRVALLHSFQDIECDVLSFWTFYLGHPFLDNGETIFWKIFLPFKGVGKIFLMISFLENKQIKELLDLIGWLDGGSKRMMALKSGNS